MEGRSVSSRCDFTGDDLKRKRSEKIAHKEAGNTYESGSVGSKVLEEVGQAIKGDEAGPTARGSVQLVITETESTEDSGQDDETHKLNGLSADLVDKQEGAPIPGNQTGGRKNHVTDGDVVQVGVDLFSGSTSRSTTEANLGKDDGRVETEPVKGDIEREPRPGTTEQDLAVFPLSIVSPKVTTRSLGCWGPLDGRIGVDHKGTSGEVSIDILGSLLDVSFDVHSESRSFGDSKTEVEGDSTGNTTETDQDSPAVVDVLVVRIVVLNLVLESGDDDKCNDGGGQVAPTLRCKDGGHHSTSNSLRRELRGDDGRQRVVPTDA